MGFHPLIYCTSMKKVLIIASLAFPIYLQAQEIPKFPWALNSWPSLFTAFTFTWCWINFFSRSLMDGWVNGFTGLLFLCPRICIWEVGNGKIRWYEMTGSRGVSLAEFPLMQFSRPDCLKCKMHLFAGNEMTGSWGVRFLRGEVLIQ